MRESERMRERERENDTMLIPWLCLSSFFIQLFIYFCARKKRLPESSAPFPLLIPKDILHSQIVIFTTIFTEVKDEIRAKNPTSLKENVFT